MATREYKIKRIKNLGYTVERLGKNIRATKNDRVFVGFVHTVFKQIFYGYK